MWKAIFGGESKPSESTTLSGGAGSYGSAPAKPDKPATTPVASSLRSLTAKAVLPAASASETVGFASAAKRYDGAAPAPASAPAKGVAGTVGALGSVVAGAASDAARAASGKGSYKPF